MNPDATRIRHIVSTMRPLPTLYINTQAGVAFHVEHQSRLPRVRRLIRSSLDAAMDTLRGLDAGETAIDSYDSFSITYGVSVPILTAHFGDLIRRNHDEIVQVNPPRRSGVRAAVGRWRAMRLQARTGVMTASAADLHILAEQLAGAKPRIPDEILDEFE